MKIFLKNRNIEYYKKSIEFLEKSRAISYNNKDLKEVLIFYEKYFSKFIEEFLDLKENPHEILTSIPDWFKNEHKIESLIKENEKLKIDISEFEKKLTELNNIQKQNFEDLKKEIDYNNKKNKNKIDYINQKINKLSEKLIEINSLLGFNVNYIVNKENINTQQYFSKRSLVLKVFDIINEIDNLKENYKITNENKNNLERKINNIVIDFSDMLRLNKQIIDYTNKIYLYFLGFVLSSFDEEAIKNSLLIRGKIKYIQDIQDVDDVDDDWGRTWNFINARDNIYVKLKYLNELFEVNLSFNKKIVKYFKK
jgi:hypothetical protein